MTTDQRDRCCVTERSYWCTEPPQCTFLVPDNGNRPFDYGLDLVGFFVVSTRHLTALPKYRHMRLGSLPPAGLDSSLAG